MSKSFKKASPIKLRSVLETVEKIVMINNEDEKNPVLNDLYLLIHPFVGKCNNPHQDWRDWGDKMEDKLKNY